MYKQFFWYHIVGIIVSILSIAFIYHLKEKADQDIYHIALGIIVGCGIGHLGCMALEKHLDGDEQDDDIFSH